MEQFSIAELEKKNVLELKAFVYDQIAVMEQHQIAAVKIRETIKTLNQIIAQKEKENLFTKEEIKKALSNNGKKMGEETCQHP